MWEQFIEQLRQIAAFEQARQGGGAALPPGVSMPSNGVPFQVTPDLRLQYFGAIPPSPEVDLTQQVNSGPVDWNTKNLDEFRLDEMKSGAERAHSNMRSKFNAILLQAQNRFGDEFYDILADRIGMPDNELFRYTDVVDAWFAGKLDHQFLQQLGADPDVVADWHKAIFDAFNTNEGHRVQQHHMLDLVAGGGPSEPVSPSEVANFYNRLADAQKQDPRVAPNPYEKTMFDTGYGKAHLEAKMQELGIPAPKALNILNNYERGLFGIEEALHSAVLEADYAEVEDPDSADAQRRKLHEVKKLRENFTKLLPDYVDREQVLQRLADSYGMGEELRPALRRIQGLEYVDPARLERIIQRGQAVAFYEGHRSANPLWTRLFDGSGDMAFRRLGTGTTVDDVESMFRWANRGTDADLPSGYKGYLRSAYDDFASFRDVANATPQEIDALIEDIRQSEGFSKRQKQDLIKNLESYRLQNSSSVEQAKVVAPGDPIRRPVPLGPELDPANRYHQEAFRGLLSQMTGGQDTTSLTARLAGLSREDLEGVKAAVADPDVTRTWFDVLGGPRIDDNSPFTIGPNTFFKNQEINPAWRQFLGEFVDDQIARTPPPYNPPTNPGMGMPRTSRPWDVGGRGTFEQLPWELGGRAQAMPAVVPPTGGSAGGQDTNRMLSDIDRLIAQAGRPESALDSLFPLNAMDRIIMDQVDNQMLRDFVRGGVLPSEGADTRFALNPDLFEGFGDDAVEEGDVGPLGQDVRHQRSIERFNNQDDRRWGGSQGDPDFISLEDEYRGLVEDGALPDGMTYQEYVDQRRMLDSVRFNRLPLEDSGSQMRVWPNDPRRTALGVSNKLDLDMFLLERDVDATTSKEVRKLLAAYDDGPLSADQRQQIMELGRATPSARIVQSIEGYEPAFTLDDAVDYLRADHNESHAERMQRLLSDDKAYRQFLEGPDSEVGLLPDGMKRWRTTELAEGLENVRDELNQIQNQRRLSKLTSSGQPLSEVPLFYSSDLADSMDLSVDALEYWIGAEPYNPALDASGDYGFGSGVRTLAQMDELERLQTGVSPRETLMAQYASAYPEDISPRIPQHNQWMDNLFGFMSNPYGNQVSAADPLVEIDRVLAENTSEMGGARATMVPPTNTSRGFIPGGTVAEFPPDRPTGRFQMPPTQQTRPGANPFLFENPPPPPPGVDARQFYIDWLDRNGASATDRARFFRRGGPASRYVTPEGLNAPLQVGADQATPELVRQAASQRLDDMGASPTERARYMGGRGPGGQAGRLVGELDNLNRGLGNLGAGGAFDMGASGTAPEIDRSPVAPSPMPAADPFRQPRRDPFTAPPGFQPESLFSPPPTQGPPMPAPDPFQNMPPRPTVTPTPPPYNPKPPVQYPPPYNPVQYPPPYNPKPPVQYPPPYNPQPNPVQYPPPYNPQPNPVQYPPPYNPTNPSSGYPGAFTLDPNNPDHMKAFQGLNNTLAGGGGPTRRSGLIGQLQRAADRIPGGWTYGKPGWSNMKNFGANAAAGLAGGVVGSVGGQALDDSSWLGGEDSFFNDAAAKALKWGGFGAGFGPKGALIGALVGLGHEGLERVGILGDGSDTGSDPDLVNRVYQAGLQAGVPPSELDPLLNQYNQMLSFADTADDPEAARQQMANAFRQSVMDKFTELSTPGDGTSPEERQALAMAVQAQIGSMVRPYADEMMRSGDVLADSYESLAANNPNIADFANRQAAAVRYGANSGATNFVNAQLAAPMYQSLQRQADYFNSQVAKLQQQALQPIVDGSGGDLDSLLAQFRGGMFGQQPVG